MRLLVISPGRTPTKVVVFEGEEQVLKKDIIHTQEELSGFSRVFGQFGYRRGLILKTLEEEGMDVHGPSRVAGRGGFVNPIPDGTCRVNERMLEDLEHAVHGEHPSNLGAALARSIGGRIGVPPFAAGPVSVDELMPKVRISSTSDLERPSWFHTLGRKAVTKWTTKRIGKKYEESSLIIAHLGPGNPVVVHENGQMIGGGGGRTNGPFSPERSSGFPTYPLVGLCYSERYIHEEMVAKISNAGGVYDYLSTKDAGEVGRQMGFGDETAKLIYKAFVYMVAKEIYSYAAVFEGKVDCVVLTRSIAHSQCMIDEIRHMVGFLAPMEVVAREFEMTALALGALRVLKGEEEPREYE